MTKISEITIENFRGIKKAEIKQLDQVNIFIGKNGAGKSTILEAIYLASAWADPIDKFRQGIPDKPSKKIDYVIFRRGMRGNWIKFKNFLWYLQDQTKPIKFRILLNNHELLFIIYHQSSGGDVWLDLNKLLTNEHFYYSILNFLVENIPPGIMVKLTRKHRIRFKSEILDLINRILRDGLHKYPLFNYASGNFSNYGIRDFSDLVYEEVPLGKYICDFFELKFKEILSYFSGIMLLDKLSLASIKEYEKKFWPRLLAKRHDKLLVEMLNNGLEEGIEGLTYVPIDDEYVLVAQLPDTSIRIDDLGEGARDSLLIMMPILISENTAILLEEPEAHLHPGGLYLFLQYLFHAARERNLQLFITTHSIELVNMALSIGEEDKIGVKVFYVERDKNGVVDTRILEKVDVDTLQKLGLDPRFLGVI